MIILVYLAIAFYIWRIIKAILNLFGLFFCIRKTAAFVTAYENRASGWPSCDADYRKQLLSLLSHTAILSQYLYSVSLSHKLSAHLNYKEAKVILGNLRDLKSYKVKDLLTCLNPFSALSALLLAPMNLFSSFGIRLNWFFNAILDILSAVSACLVESHIDEIVEFIKMFLNSLVQ